MIGNGSQGAGSSPSLGQRFALELLQLVRCMLEFLGEAHFVLIIVMMLWPELVSQNNANFFQGRGVIHYIYVGSLFLTGGAKYIAMRTRLGSDPLFILAKDSLGFLSFELKTWATVSHGIWILINLGAIALSDIRFRGLLDILKEIIKKPPANTVPSEVSSGPTELEMIPV